MFYVLSFSFFNRYEIAFIGSQLGIDMTGNQYWIGLSQDEWGSYTWIDGSYMWDDNWGEGEPGMYTLGGLNLDWSELG